MVGKKRMKQTTMPKMLGKADALGRAADRYLDARKAVTDAKEELQTAANKLVGMMREKKRQQIRVEGAMITLRRVESQDLLKVRKPKEP